ncbi:unnamed protein product [Musa acuminata subsp. burmannicoides]
MIVVQHYCQPHYICITYLLAAMTTPGNVYFIATSTVASNHASQRLWSNHAQSKTASKRHPSDGRTRVEATHGHKLRPGGNCAWAEPVSRRQPHMGIGRALGR